MFVFGGRERLLYLLALYTQKVSCQSCVSHILYLKNPALFMLERPIFVSRRHYKNGSALCGADLRYTFFVYVFYCLAKNQSADFSFNFGYYFG